MKLRLKLPLAFAFSLALMLAAALFGIYRLNQAIGTFENDVLLHVAAHKKAAEVSTRFSTAIQEWKNVLLRGKSASPAQRAGLERAGATLRGEAGDAQWWALPRQGSNP